MPLVLNVLTKALKRPGDSLLEHSKLLRSMAEAVAVARASGLSPQPPPPGRSALLQQRLDQALVQAAMAAAPAQIVTLLRAGAGSTGPLGKEEATDASVERCEKEDALLRVLQCLQQEGSASERVELYACCLAVLVSAGTPASRHHWRAMAPSLMCPLPPECGVFLLAATPPQLRDWVMRKWWLGLLHMVLRQPRVPLLGLMLQHLTREASEVWDVPRFLLLLRTARQYGHSTVVPRVLLTWAPLIAALLPAGAVAAAGQDIWDCAWFPRHHGWAEEAGKEWDACTAAWLFVLLRRGLRPELGRRASLWQGVLRQDVQVVQLLVQEGVLAPAALATQLRHCQALTLEAVPQGWLHGPDWRREAVRTQRWDCMALAAALPSREVLRCIVDAWLRLEDCGLGCGGGAAEKVTMPSATDLLEAQEAKQETKEESPAGTPNAVTGAAAEGRTRGTQKENDDDDTRWMPPAGSPLPAWLRRGLEDGSIAVNKDLLRHWGSCDEFVLASLLRRHPAGFLLLGNKERSHGWQKRVAARPFLYEAVAAGLWEGNARDTAFIRVWCHLPPEWRRRTHYALSRCVTPAAVSAAALWAALQCLTPQELQHHPRLWQEWWRRPEGSQQQRAQLQKRLGQRLSAAPIAASGGAP